MNTSEFFRLAFERGQGVLRLAPTWVPRALLRPGGRLRLHPNDLYALGGQRGGIDERWLASNVVADNGPGTPADEGLSYVEMDGDCVPLREFTGDSWQVLCKLFDNAVPIPLHVHPNDAQASMRASAALGRILIDLGRTGEAIGLMESALAAAPQPSWSRGTKRCRSGYNS